MVGELLMPHAAAKRAAFADWTNEQVSARYGVSTQFARQGEVERRPSQPSVKVSRA